MGVLPIDGAGDVPDTGDMKRKVVVGLGMGIGAVCGVLAMSGSAHASTPDAAGRPAMGATVNVAAKSESQVMVGTGVVLLGGGSAIAVMARRRLATLPA